MEHTRRLNHTHPAHAHPHTQCIVHLRLHIPARPSTLRMRALGQVHTHTNTHARTHTHTHTGQPSQALAASPAGPPVIAPSPGVWQIALAGRRLRPLINPSFSRAPSADAPRTAARQAQPQPRLVIKRQISAPGTCLQGCASSRGRVLSPRGGE